MTGAQALLLLPFFIVAGISIVVMLMIAVKRMYNATVWVTLIGLAVSFVFLFVIPSNETKVPPLLTVDAYTRVLLGLVLASNFVVAIFGYRYIGRYDENREEYYFLLTLETLGAMVLVAAIHFISFLLGLELMSVSLYGLLAYVRSSDVSMESGTKYFILTAVASAVLVFGLALIYYEVGSMSLAEFGSAVAKSASASSLTVIGVLLVFAGVGFKLAIFPFHMWAADVYEGSPVPSTATIATVSKVGAFVFLYRFLTLLPLDSSPAIRIGVVVIAAASMLGGNLLALLQTDIKRIIAYSSTANLGYLLIPILAGGSRGLESAAFYLIVYSATLLGIFGVLTVFGQPGSEISRLAEYRGFAWKRPALSISLVVMMLSLAGVPISAGFFGKFYLFTAGIGSALWFISWVFVAGSAIGLFYYLRVVAIQISNPGDSATDGEEETRSELPKATTPFLISVMLVILTLGVLFFGAYPSPLLNLLHVISA